MCMTILKSHPCGHTTYKPQEYDHYESGTICWAAKLQTKTFAKVSFDWRKKARRLKVEVKETI